MTPDPTTRELTLTQLHPGVTVEQVLSQTGWPLKVAGSLQITAAPTAGELETLRALHSRTKLAHAQGASA
jgi:glutaconate CoA-transferase subunit B